jgi:hypothetical protein
MRTYYRDEHVHITSSAIYVDNRCYPLARIDSVWRRRRSLAGRRILIGLGIVALAVLLRAAASYVWWLGGLNRFVRRWLSGGPVTAAIIAVVVLAVAVAGVVTVEAALSAIEDIRGNGRHLELWAVINGQAVLLLRTNDSSRFGKICRALVRARSG